MILYMVDLIGEYAVHRLNELGGKKLKSTTNDGLDTDVKDDKK